MSFICKKHWLVIKHAYNSTKTLYTHVLVCMFIKYLLSCYHHQLILILSSIKWKKRQVFLVSLLFYCKKVREGMLIQEGPLFDIEAYVVGAYLGEYTC